jgi:hypothetical protein
MSKEMNKILLRTVDAALESEEPATLRGTFVREKHACCGKDYSHYGLPEFGPARLFYDGFRLIHHEGVVVSLGGRLYRVRFIPVGDNGSGAPDGGTVEFIPTTDPQTYHLPGGPNVRLPYLTFFGQPRFIQNPVFPGLDGVCASNLFTLETGWGDAGNLNVLCALDDEGIPAKVWHEASCA